MKKEQMFLSDLTPNSSSYKVKVKVIEKGRAKTSPKKGVVYQSLLLQDDKGNKMRGALFGEQVEAFKDAFVYNGVYEIANAPIKPCSDQWKTSAEQLDYQMSFGRQTVIQAVDAASGTILPQYTCISNIPRAGESGDKFDVLGVVLYVEEKPRKVVTTKKYDAFVREIVIADHSVEAPLVISTWNEIAEADCEALFPLSHNFKVIGFTALKTSNHKGFSLSSSMSTTLILTPEGLQAKALGDWALHHQDALVNRRQRVIDARNPSADQQITTIYALKLKKPTVVLPEENYLLRGQVSEVTLDRVYAYTGCSKCRRSADAPVDTPYECKKCQSDSVSIGRVTFSCELVDSTGSLQMTMFTETCEQLFRLHASDIFRMKVEEDHLAFKKVNQSLANRYVIVQVAPTAALARNAVLQWTPQKVEFEEVNLQGSKKAMVEEVEVRVSKKANITRATSKTVEDNPTEDNKDSDELDNNVLNEDNETSSSDP